MSSNEEAVDNPLTKGESIYDAPLEDIFERVVTPIEYFIQRQSTSGLILMFSAFAALIIANSPLAAFYEQLSTMQAGLSLGGWELRKDLHHWINDGLMALFFFVIGLELKRELFVGELASPKQAILPISAAMGGIVMPALFYTAFNLGEPTMRGWGIPIATDIAFAIGALSLLGSRVPRSLLAFLIGLAIVDDLAAVLVIALFYTENLSIAWLLAGAAVTSALMLLNGAGVRRITPYFILALLLWYTLLQSGVHATLAGVIGAFTVPARPKYDPGRFSTLARGLLDRFDNSYQESRNILLNHQLGSLVQTLRNGIIYVQPPLSRLERIWNLPVAFLVLPLFAFVNAGVPLNTDSLANAAGSAVTHGIVVGLLGGKLLGIWLASWLMVKLGFAALPRGVSMSHIAAVALMAGIGFTMSIFIAELAFSNMQELLTEAKTGILFASLIAGLSGYAWLYRMGSGTQDSQGSSD